MFDQNPYSLIQKEVQKEINDQYYQKKIDEAYERGVAAGREEVLKEEMIRLDVARKLKLSIETDDIDTKIARIKAECKASHA